MLEEDKVMATRKTAEKKDSKGLLDRGLSKLASRKLMVWATATSALFLGVLTPPEWVQICLLYIGSQAAVDMVAAYRNSGT